MYRSGAEEFVSEFAEWGLNKWMVGDDERAFKDVSKDAWYSALIGALTSVAMSAPVETLKRMGPKQLAETVAQETQERLELEQRAEELKLPDPAKAAGEEIAITKEEAATRSNSFWKKIGDYVDRAIARSIKVENPVISDTTYKDLQIGAIIPEQVEKIKNEYGKDLSGYKHVMRDNDIRHMYNSHGPHTSEALPVTAEDIKKIPTIVDNPSEIYLLNKPSGKSGLMYRYDDQHSTYYLEAILDDAKILLDKQMIKVPLGEYPDIAELKAEIKRKSTSSIPDDAAGAVPQMYVQDAKADATMTVPQPASEVKTDLRLPTAEEWANRTETPAKAEPARDLSLPKPEDVAKGTTATPAQETAPRDLRLPTAEEWKNRESDESWRREESAAEEAARREAEEKEYRAARAEEEAEEAAARAEREGKQMERGAMIPCPAA